MKKFIAVTGGIGCGKTTVIEQVKELGYPVFSCDKIYHQILECPDYIRDINENFNNVVVNGRIDRSALRELVFESQEVREKVNALAHPRIMAKLFSLMRDCEDDLAFAEVPLLFEGNYQKDFDGVIVVLRNISARIKAICERDGGDEETALQKIRAQFDYESKENLRKLQTEKIRIIRNDGAKEELKYQVEKAIEFFL